MSSQASGNRASRAAQPQGCQAMRSWDIPAILGSETDHIDDHYTRGTELENGKPWIYCLCKTMWEYYACKSIERSSILEAGRTNIKIMHRLAGKENIGIKDVYEDICDVHIVMEPCIGEGLFERIKKTGEYSLRKAAKLTKTIVGVIETCHSLGVTLGDLNETFIFVNKDDDSPLKAVNFGSAEIPVEEFEARNAQRNDIRSAGWILYALVTGVKMQEEKQEQILHGMLTSGETPEWHTIPKWHKIPSVARSLIKKMLGGIPVTATDVLANDWIRTNGIAPGYVPDIAEIARLKKSIRKINETN